MPPQIPLVLITAFVVYLLRMESRQTASLSRALWIPTIWIMYCASRPLALWFGTTAEANIESGSFLDRMFLTPMILLGLMILLQRGFNFGRALRDNRALTIVLIFTLVSLVWTEHPFVCFKRWIRGFGTVVMALVIASEKDGGMALRSVFTRTIYVEIPFSVLTVKYYPIYGVHFAHYSGLMMWRGVTMHKNCLGVLCLVSMIFLVQTIVRRWQKKELATKWENYALGLLVLQTLFLMRGDGSYSATSILCTTVGLVIFFLVLRFKGSAARFGQRALIVLSIGGVLAVSLKVLEISPLALVAQSLGRDPNLTGRADDIWPILIKEGMKRPILGSGYGDFWNLDTGGVNEGPDGVNEAHNGYLEVFLNLGIVGLILLIPMLVSFYQKACRDFSRDRDWAGLRMACFVAVVVHNVTEASFFGDTFLLWNLFMALLFAPAAKVSSPVGQEPRGEEADPFGLELMKA